MRARWVAVLVAGVAGGLPATASAADSFFWPNGGGNSVSRANLDGTGGGSSVSLAGTTVANPLGVALDPSTNSLYIASFGNDRIVRVNLDGTGGGESLDTSGATVDGPSGVAVDPATNSIYWSNLSGNKISRANLDGTGGGEDLDTTGATVDGPRGLAIDPASNTIAWTNATANTIGRANLDGTGGGGMLDTTGATVDVPEDILIDPSSGTVLWSNLDADNVIGRANLDGTGGGADISLGGTVSNLSGLALDPTSATLYWSKTANAFWWANLASPAVATTLSTASAPINGPQGIALLTAPIGTAMPVVSGGTFGGTLTCSTGAWAADVPGDHFYRAPGTFTRQWSRDGADLPGANAATLTADAAGTYRCRVTATNAAGSAVQTSDPVVVSAPPSAPAAAPPVVGGVAPDQGPPSGGTAVTITGSNFGAVQRVLFGEIAANFRVDRFDRITATAPPHTPGTVSVRVQTTAGTSASTSLGAFTYVLASDAPPRPVTVEPVTTTRPARCHVPNLVGRTPKTAKRRILAAGCRVGHVTRRRHRHHGAHIRHVIFQHPAARSDRPADTSVSIVVR